MLTHNKKSRALARLQYDSVLNVNYAPLPKKAGRRHRQMS